jgi:hypothetical protein
MMAARSEPHGGGWLSFAGTLILLGGIFNIIDGVVALNNSTYLVNHLIWGDLRAWGWTILGLGIIEVLAAFAIFGGRTWGALVGIFVALLNAIGQLMFLGTYPVWSIIMIALDVLVIYGLTVYGLGRVERA